MVRTIAAGIAGALIMFVWAYVAHDMLPTARVGLKTMPAAGEAAVMGAISGATSAQAGLYVAPAAAMNMQPDAPKSGPTALIVYRPDVQYQPMPIQIVGEFVLELVQCVILAFILAGIAAGAGARIGFALAAGVMVGISTNGSYHIWFGFPHDYTAVQIGIQVVEYLLAGIVIALILPKRA